VHRPKDVQNTYEMPEGLKCALTIFWLCICDSYDFLGVQDFSLLCKTGVCQKVLSDNTGKLINITTNCAYNFIVWTITFHPRNHSQVEAIHIQGFCSCKTVFHLSCEFHKMRLTTFWQKHRRYVHYSLLEAFFISMHNRKCRS
jgi:hypothetical protein